MGKFGTIIAWGISVIVIAVPGAILVVRMNNKAVPGTPVAKLLGKG